MDDNSEHEEQLVRGARCGFVETKRKGANKPDLDRDAVCRVCVICIISAFPRFDVNFEKNQVVKFLTLICHHVKSC